MEELFAKLAISTVSLVGKAAFSAASGAVIKSVASQIQARSKNEEDSKTWDTLQRLQQDLQLKLQIINPAVDMCEIAAARGNSYLASVVDLTAPIRTQIRQLLRKLGSIGELDTANDVEPLDPADLIKDVQGLIDCIEATMPYIQLATSVSNLSHTIRGTSNTTKGGSWSASRLMLASSLLSAAHRSLENYLQSSSTDVSPIAVYSCRNVRLYTLFTSSARAKGKTDYTWKEEFCKARCTLSRRRSRQSSEYDYVLSITENLNDGRFHEGLDMAKLEDRAFVKGRERTLPVSAVNRIFYATSGKLLKIEDSTSPVLILKVVESLPKRNSLPQTPSTIKPKVDWYALEILDDEDLDDSNEEEVEEDQVEEKKLLLSENDFGSIEAPGKLKASAGSTKQKTSSSEPIRELSVLEHCVILAGLEVTEQLNHLNVTDEMLAVYFSNDRSMEQRTHEKDVSDSNQQPLAPITRTPQTPRTSLQRTRETPSTFIERLKNSAQTQNS